jgi:hypothetical protein
MHADVDGRSGQAATGEALHSESDDLPAAHASAVLPVVKPELRQRIMQLLWANWDVSGEKDCDERVAETGVVRFCASHRFCRLAPLLEPPRCLAKLCGRALSVCCMQWCLSVWAPQDQLAQTVRQVQVAFEALLDILELQQRLRDAAACSALADDIDARAFLLETARELLATGVAPGQADRTARLQALRARSPRSAPLAARRGQTLNPAVRRWPPVAAKP